MRGNPGLFIPFATHDILTVVITNPTEGQAVTDAGIKFTWTTNTVDQQLTYRLRIFSDALLTNAVYDSGVINSSVQVATLPFPGLLTSAATYYVVVDATDTFGLSGTSDAVAFSVQWYTGFTDPINRWQSIGDCSGRNGGVLPGILFKWTAPTSTPAGGIFYSIEVYRRDTSSETNFRRMAISYNAGTNQFEDYDVCSGIVYQYFASYQYSVGIELRASGPPGSMSNRANAIVTWDHFWIHRKDSPLTDFVRFDSFEANIMVDQQISFQRTWGSLAPVMRIGDQESRRATVPSLTQELSYRAAWDRLRNLQTKQRTNAIVLVARWGKAKEMMYCQLGGARKNQHQGDYDQEIELVEVRATVGV